jgi:hypothetical protein
MDTIPTDHFPCVTRLGRSQMVQLRPHNMSFAAPVTIHVPVAMPADELAALSNLRLHLMFYDDRTALWTKAGHTDYQVQEASVVVVSK